MKNSLLALVFISINSLAVAGAANGPQPPTVENVELSRYLGKWNELERIPNEFQDNIPAGYSTCYNTTAEYSLRENGKIDVLNTCYREIDGKAEKVEVAKAIGRVVRNSGNAKLKVNFTGIALLRWLGIGDGNYWILGLGAPLKETAPYKWAVVGSPKLDYGWVLSRTTNLNQNDWDEINEVRLNAGYRLEQFVKTRR